MNNDRFSSFNSEGRDEHLGIGTEHFEGAAAFSDNLFEIAWRGRWLIALALVLTLVGGFVYISKATPIFRSNSRLYIEQAGPRIIESQGVVARSNNYLYTQAELLRSSPIITAVADLPGIRSLRTFNDIDNPSGYIKSALTATVGKQDELITVSFESPYPEDAALIVNSIVDSYITYQASRKKSTATEVLRILERQKQKALEDLDRQYKELLDFQRNNPTITFETSRGNVIMDRLAELAKSLTDAELRTLDAQSNYETIKNFTSDASKMRQFVEAQRSRGIYVAGASEYSRLQAQLNMLELELTEKRRQLAEEHPYILSIKERIAQTIENMKRQDELLVETQLAVAEHNYISAKQNEDQIRSYFEEQRAQALNFNESLTQYTILKSAIQRTESLSDILDGRIKEVSITEDAGILNISILEVAKAPSAPFKPQKARVMAMALVLGAMLGFGLAFLHNLLDHRFRNIDEIAATLGCPILGTVSHFAKDLTIPQKGKRSHLKPDSNISESYKTIRTAIFFGVPEGQAKRILITSPLQGDGKTTTAANLAITMAQAGQKTLLLDCDFRRPMQNVVFEIEQQPGLTTVLSGEAELKSVLRDTGIENLSIITTGQKVPNPSEMLNSKKFAQVLEELSNDFDRVIIDAPPVMPVTDARILGALCSATVLVLRAESSTRRASLHAIDGLTSVGAKVLGVVINDVPKSRGRLGYYSGYGYSRYGRYGYGYGYGYGNGKYGSYGKDCTAEG